MTVTFYVTTLDPSCSVVLGYNWLARYNLLIDWVSKSITFLTTRTIPMTSIASDSELTQLPAQDTSPPQTPNNPTPPNISLVNAVAFARACKLAGSQSFRLYTSQLADVSDNPSDPSEADLPNIPEEYHDFADVFSKSRSNKLPEHCPYDLKIKLEEGTEPPLGPMYSLSQVELQALQTFMDENLTTGFIQST